LDNFVCYYLTDPNKWPYGPAYVWDIHSYIDLNKIDTSKPFDYIITFPDGGYAAYTIDLSKYK